MSECRRMQLDPYISTCIKLKSNWIKDLNINPNALNLIEEKVGNNLKLIDTGENFLSRTQIAQTLKLTINKWNLMKFKSFCKTQNKTATKRRKYLYKSDILQSAGFQNT